jgi:glutamine---fructose-6-phosphate transaminase (isomerizing)
LHPRGSRSSTTASSKISGRCARNSPPKGYSFATETDSEIAAFVVEDELGKGKPPEAAVHAALARLRGAFALVYLFEGEEDPLDRRAPRRAVGDRLWRREMYLGSDALALAPFTDRIAYLEEGGWVALTRERADIRVASGSQLERRIQRRLAGRLLAEAGTAYMAGFVCKYWIERLVRLPGEIDVASEYRYREAPIDDGGSPSSYRNRARRPTPWPGCAT